MRRRAWWILAFFTVTLVVFGLGDVANGVQADPGITLAISGLSPDEVRAAEPTAFRLYDYATRSAGIVLTVLGLVLSAIVAGPYRQGQRWAWNTMWLLPAWAILAVLTFIAEGRRGIRARRRPPDAGRG